MSIVGLGWLAVFCIVFGLAPSVLYRRMIEAGGVMSGSTAFDPGRAAELPLLLGALPLLGALGAFLYARPARRAARADLDLRFGRDAAFAIHGDRVLESRPGGSSPSCCFPNISKSATSAPRAGFRCASAMRSPRAYVFDEVARNIAAAGQKLARRSRIVQAGLLRVYLAYAVVAVLILLVIAR